MSGFVYFIRCGDYVKIGYSTDPNKRLRNLGTASPQKMNLVASFPGAPEDERRVHKLCSKYRTHREWFRWGEEIERLTISGLPSIEPPAVAPRPKAADSMPVVFKQLLAVVDVYRAATGLAETTVSTKLFNDGKRLRSVRNGRDIGERKVHAAFIWLSTYWPSSAVWPEDIRRPALNENPHQTYPRGVPLSSLFDLTGAAACAP